MALDGDRFGDLGKICCESDGTSGKGDGVVGTVRVSGGNTVVVCLGTVIDVPYGFGEGARRASGVSSLPVATVKEAACVG